MDLTNKSKAELADELISLAASLKDEDLENPETFALVSQLVQILDPAPDQLPAELAERLKQMPDPRDRLMEAAMATGAKDRDQIAKLVESLKSAGLFKAEDLEKISPKEVQNSHILMMPVTIRGARKAFGDHADYHVTVKWLGNDHPIKHEQIQDLVNRHQVHPPSNFDIVPDVWHTPRGPVHVLKLTGDHKSLHAAHDELSENNPSLHPFTPHITVPKELYDEVKQKGLTAKDLNIKIKPLEYRVGDKTEKQFVPAPQATEHFPPMKIAKAEDMDIKEKAKQTLEKLKKSMSSARENMKRVSGLFHREHIGTDEDACVQDFDASSNIPLENKVVEQLSLIAKGKRDSYEGAPADLKIISGIHSPEKPKTDKKKTNLLSPEETNVKTAKNANVGGFYSEMLSLAPANLAGRGNTCPGLSAGCKASCLNTAGMGGMVSKDNPINGVQAARIKKTQHLFDHPHDFFNQLDKEINRVKTRAKKKNAKPVVRLNGTSDLAWENFKPKAWDGKNVFERHPDVQFHDYTARPERVRNNKHPNYHLTFSLKEDNHDIAKQLLNEGHNVAVPFGFNTRTATKEEKETGNYNITRPLPKTHWGHNVIDGEAHDLRFLDPKGNKETGGNIVGLRAKGDAMYDKSGFVQWGHSGQPDSKPKERKSPTKEEIIQEGLRQKRKKDEGGGGEPLAASEAGKSLRSLMKHEPTPTPLIGDKSSYRIQKARNSSDK